MNKTDLIEGTTHVPPGPPTPPTPAKPTKGKTR